MKSINQYHFLKKHLIINNTKYNTTNHIILGGISLSLSDSSLLAR